MHVRFWGTRGSIATPGFGTAKYGGNTSCVEVRSDDGTVIILDAGTGVRPLGLHLLNTLPKPLRLHLLIGHTHWDHIQGFPFFTPSFVPNTEVNLYAPLGFQHGLAEAMAGQMEYPYFPVSLKDLRSRMHFNELAEGFFRIGDILVETQYLNHTAPTVAYRLSSRGASIAYVTDHEPFWKPSDAAFRHPGDLRHVAFLKGVDLIIHDGQYSNEEYPAKVGWGHSTVEYATDVALAAGASRLALFHHDPMHDDAAVEKLEARAQARAADRRPTLEVFAAYEGLELNIQGGGASPTALTASAMRRGSIAGGRVLVVSANEGDVASVGQALVEDDLVLLPVPDMRTALERVRETRPDLAIVDERLPDGDGRAMIDRLRACEGLRGLPAMLLTDSTGDQLAFGGEASDATDYLVKPFSPPMLHSRIRAWLDRARAGHIRASDGLAESATEEGISAGTGGPSGKDAAVGLEGLSLFSMLSQEQRVKLVARAIEHTYPSGCAVFRQDEAADKVYVVLSGRVRVVEFIPEMPLVDRFLGELGRGEIFGELGMLTGERRSATVVAVERTQCLAIPQNDFLHVLQESSDLAVALLRVLAKRLYNADVRLARYAPDPLTGLIGRRAFLEQYRRMAVVARRHHSAVTVLLFDVLHLKTLNDRFGYDIGDELLRTVADALVGSVRTTDIAARYGGDEFVVMMVEAEPREVDDIVDRVHEKLAALAARRGLPRETRCLVGKAVSDDPPDSADALLWVADQDLRLKK